MMRRRGWLLDMTEAAEDGITAAMDELSGADDERRMVADAT